jgi:hypothetical protein
VPDLGDDARASLELHSGPARLMGHATLQNLRAKNENRSYLR